MGEHGRGHGAVRERRPPGQRREQDAAERVDVGARVGQLAAQLLRRAVLDGADPATGLGQRGVGAREARQAEVAQVGVVAGEQHVGGLDVAMDQAGRVGGVERGGDLRHELGGALGLELPAIAQERVQVGARHIAHHQVQRPVVLPGRVDRDHVRMVDRSRHARLALEAFPELLIAGALGRQELQRHRPPETQLGGPVDHAHAAAAGHRFDAAAGELFAVFEFGHTRIVTRSPGYAGAMDLGNPSSYLVLAGGTPVVTSDGHEIGRVEHVLADAGEDVFDAPCRTTSRTSSGAPGTTCPGNTERAPTDGARPVLLAVAHGRRPWARGRDRSRRGTRGPDPRRRRARRRPPGHGV